MNWLCKNCETINNSEEFICEVCGKRRPALKYYRYEMAGEYGTFNLQWESEETTEVYLLKKGKKISLDVSGSYLLKNCKNKESITLLLKNEIAEYKSEITILYEKPKIKLFEIDEERILVGNKINVKWETINSSKTQITGIGEVNPIGNRRIKVEEHEVRLIAENELGRVEAIKTIEIIPQPVIRFFADKIVPRYEVGDSISFKWQTANATKIELDTPTGKVDVSELEEYKINATDSYTFRLIATALDGYTFFEKEIDVEVFQKPVIFYFTVEPEVVVDVMPVTLSWKVEHSRCVKITGVGIVPQEGKKELLCSKSAVFSLIAKGELSDVSIEATARVFPTPIIETLKVPMPDFESHVHVDFDLRPPKIDLGVRTPINLNMPFIKFTEPKISTLDIKIPNLMAIRLKENLIKLPHISNNFLSNFKRLYNYVRGKIRAQR